MRRFQKATLVSHRFLRLKTVFKPVTVIEGISSVPPRPVLEPGTKGL